MAGAFVRDAGGSAEVVATETHPLIVGDLAASDMAQGQSLGHVPTVLVYGHVDVQPPDPLELWESDPYTLEQRDEWLYARGVVDDKGQLYMLAKAATELAAAGELPVNVRFACDSEEETGGHQIVDFLAADERGADAALIFDSGMTTRGVPEFAVATRGLVYFHVTLRTGERDLHSGLFGGAALNAVHALTQALSSLRQENGRLPEPLRAGIAPPTDEERAAWAELVSGEQMLAEGGARPVDEQAADEFYLRTTAEPALDVNGIQGGSPVLQKTVLPIFAEANLSIRLAPGQDVETIAGAVEQLLRRRDSGGSRARAQEALRRRGRACPPGCAGGAARPGRLRANDGPPAAARPLGRHAPDRARARGQGHPDDRHRLRHPGEQHPLAERAPARGLHAARDRDGARAVQEPCCSRGVERARRTRATRARSGASRR